MAWPPGVDRRSVGVGTFFEKPVFRLSEDLET
jgi:hypothetical protein